VSGIGADVAAKRSNGKAQRLARHRRAVHQMDAGDDHKNHVPQSGARPREPRDPAFGASRGIPLRAAIARTPAPPCDRRTTPARLNGIYPFGLIRIATKF